MLRYQIPVSPHGAEGDNHASYIIGGTRDHGANCAHWCRHGSGLSRPSMAGVHCNARVAHFPVKCATSIYVFLNDANKLIQVAD